jgi:hypothetical protein
MGIKYRSREGRKIMENITENTTDENPISENAENINENIYQADSEKKNTRKKRKKKPRKRTAAEKAEAVRKRKETIARKEAAAKETGVAVGRRKRVPLGVPRARLNVNKKKGYVRRWVNDRDGRILRAQEGGYNFAKRDEVDFIDSDVCNEDRICKVVSPDGTKAYLMEISQEFYDEDQAEKKKLVDATEEALRSGSDAHGAPGRDGRYIPQEGIKITNQLT